MPCSTRRRPRRGRSPRARPPSPDGPTMSRSTPLAESRPARSAVPSPVAESAHSAKSPAAAEPARVSAGSGASPTPASGAAAPPPQPPRGGDQTDYLRRRLGAAPRLNQTDRGQAFPQRPALERLFGEPLTGLDLAFGVPAPGGRRDAHAAARGNRVEFADREPPLDLLLPKTLRDALGGRGGSVLGRDR